MEELISCVLLKTTGKIPR